MKIDGGLMGTDLEVLARTARELEAVGYDGVQSAETSHDPFLPLLVAAEHTDQLELSTSIAVAFARNPMLLANVGHDLNAYSKGRFILGLGSQIRAHITRRFSMPWSRPAARMRELVLAMRAIWDCWYGGKKLDFRGDFYSHTLMTPMFTPPDAAHGAPRVMIAGVNPRMTEVAGEVADGFIAHAFTTERYLREVTIPAIERGLSRAGRARGAFELCCPIFVVTGESEQRMEASRAATRAQIAFYASTPAYRPVLELHGLGDLQTELRDLSLRGAWSEMGGRIDDAMLEDFAVVAPPERLAERIAERSAGVIDRLAFTAGVRDPDRLAEIVKQLKSLPARR
jgi:probable F420-dependent oxidoreductase